MGNVHVHNPARVSSVNGQMGNILISARNFIQGTSSEWVEHDANGVYSVSISPGYPGENDSDIKAGFPLPKELAPGDVITLSADLIAIKNAGNSIGLYLEIGQIDANDKRIEVAQSDVRPAFNNEEFDDVFVRTTILENTSKLWVGVRSGNGGRDSFSFKVRNVRLIKGTTDVGWSPAPEDIPSMAPVQSVNGGTGDIVIGVANLATGTSPGWVENKADVWNFPIGGRVELADAGLSVGDTVTVSADMEVTEGTTGWLIGAFVYEQGGGNHQELSSAIRIGEPHRMSYTYTIKDGDIAIEPRIFRGSRPFANGRYRRAKLERGNIATDWTPAPEDILTRLAALEAKAGITYEPSVEGPEIMDGPGEEGGDGDGDLR